MTVSLCIEELNSSCDKNDVEPEYCKNKLEKQSFCWEPIQTDSAFFPLFFFFGRISSNPSNPECETCAQTPQISGAQIAAWCVWCCGRMLQTPPANRQPLCCLQQMQRHQTENTAGYSLLNVHCVLLFLCCARCHHRCSPFQLLGKGCFCSQMLGWLKL